MTKANIGVIGLAVMGENLVLNMESKNLAVSVYNRTTEKVNDFIKGRAQGKNIVGAFDLPSFVAGLSRPRKIMLMIKAGQPVDEMISQLLPHLERGDIIIDGGNSDFHDTIRRTDSLAGRGILFVGAGVSGGEEGALQGPSIMPGGNPEAWPQVKPILQSIAAKVADGTPCCDWVGTDGAGHYVKMVHNGIEYCDMQMIAEAYALMQKMLGMSPADMQAVFQEWNQGELDSYLIEITGAILGQVDDVTGRPMVDIILDAAGQKGTGKWTSQSVLDLGAPAPTVAAAVLARFISAFKQERVCASGVLARPTESPDRTCVLVDDIRQALYASKICAYAQGFHLMRLAADEYHWNFDYGGIALLWREGCIIRAQFLERIKEAYRDEPMMENLMLAPYFRAAIERSQAAWRRVVVAAVLNGVPVPGFSSALAYYDSYRSEQLPANLIQAQRDYFGAHTYERVDGPRGEFFHTNWTGRGPI